MRWGRITHRHLVDHEENERMDAKSYHYQTLQNAQPMTTASLKPVLLSQGYYCIVR